MSEAKRLLIRNALAVNVVVLLVCACGVLAIRHNTRSLLPPIQKRWVRISAVLPGASAVEIERTITFRVEEALQGMDGAARIESTTENGAARVWVRMKDSESDMAAFKERISARLSAIGHRLPDDLQPLRVEERGGFSPPFMSIYVENVDLAEPSHRRAARMIVERLRRVPGVVDVDSSLPDLKLHVRFSPKALQEKGINILLARERILEHLLSMPIGRVRNGDQSVAIEIDKASNAIPQLPQLSLTMNRAGRGVRLKDVAEVEWETADRLTRLTLNGHEYVLIEPRADKEADVIDLSAAIRSALDEEWIRELPSPVTVRIGLDTSQIIAHELSTLLSNGLIGSSLVLACLLLFIGWRAGFATALGLPFCYLGAVAVLSLAAINFNAVTLLSLILMVGIIVDDSIIVSESFVRECSVGRPSEATAGAAVSQVVKPIIGMAVTSVFAFAPLLFVGGGSLSDILAPIPVVVMTILAFSLLECFVVLPNHLAHIMPATGRIKERRFVGVLRRGYRRLLGVFVRFRYLLVFGFVGLAVWSGWLLGADVPVNVSDINISPEASVYVELEESTSLEYLRGRVREVESVLEGLPEGMVDHYRATLGVGWNGKTRLRGFKYASLDVIPRGNYVEADVQAKRIAPLLQKRLDELQGFAKLYVIRRDRAASESRDVVRVFVSGKDRLEFREIQDSIREAVVGLQGVKNVFMDPERFQKSFRLVLDEDSVLAYGLTVRRVLEQLREQFAESELLLLRSRGEEIAVFVGIEEGFQPSVELLSSFRIAVPGNRAIPLRFLGDWHESEILRRIEHDNTLRVFSVDVICDGDNADKGRLAEGIESRLETVRKRYPDYYISVRPPQAESEARRWLIEVALLCVGLVFACLVFSLGNLGQPIVVMTAIPFGFVGVVLALYFHGMTLDLFAAVGSLGLAGVVVNDALVMATGINRIHDESSAGQFANAVLEGASGRFQAIIVTSLTTLAGVFPLAYGLGGDAGWFRSMVFALGWGLLFATALTLFLFPCLLVILDDVKKLGRRWR
jgi:multidrug efflux pump subunit AcrB